jgi:hypothetical protein
MIDLRVTVIDVHVPGASSIRRWQPHQRKRSETS